MDVIPELATMFSVWKRVGQQFHDLDEEVFMDFRNRMKRLVREGPHPHCFGKVFRSQILETEIDRESGSVDVVHVFSLQSIFSFPN